MRAPGPGRKEFNNEPILSTPVELFRYHSNPFYSMKFSHVYVMLKLNSALILGLPGA